MIYLIGQLEDGIDDHVKLSKWRKKNKIPNSTFYRHVESLKSLGIVETIGRDKYRLTGRFTQKVMWCHNQKALL